ncbi:MAG: hypothetical protein JWM74_5768 [Myxococcaceae bacterium]|nr:hypothetical protein [Myxococcaceae bacterium]
MSSSTSSGVRRDAVALAVFKIAIAVWLVRAGFSHISDDDYARTAIAEAFAHAPKLDPSGTSWLPFPFWITGSAMALFGRTLATARAVAVLLAAVGAAFVYVAARGAGVPRWAALSGVVLASATPWSAWCGAATVPEGFTGAFVAAALIALTTPRAIPRWAAALLVAAALSRYETWPLCLLFAVGALRRRAYFAAAIASLGPLAWMAWNQYAHGSALHFFVRVAAYRHAIGADAAPMDDQLLLYPRALVTGALDVACVGAFAIAAFCMFRAYRTRWLPALAGVALLLVFLAYGEAKGGAPTHHPERALLTAWWVLAVAGADGLFAIAKQLAWGNSKRESAAFAVGLALTCTWALRLVGHLHDHPANNAEEDRTAQIARGLALRERASAVDRVSVEPCAYEHFALIAAFGAPERVDIVSGAPGTTLGTGGARAPVTPACPRVTARSSSSPL